MCSPPSTVSGMHTWIKSALITQYRLIFVLQIRKCLIGCDRISRRSFYVLHQHINPHFHSQMQTGTHKLLHKDTHSAVLSSCHPPAKSTREKHHSTLGNKLIHVSQISSDWEQAERLWQCCCFFPLEYFMKTCSGKSNFNRVYNETQWNKHHILAICNSAQTELQQQSLTVIFKKLLTSSWSHFHFIFFFCLNPQLCFSHCISIQQKLPLFRKNWWLSTTPLVWCLLSWTQTVWNDDSRQSQSTA